jgi:hypothetical protein
MKGMEHIGFQSFPDDVNLLNQSLNTTQKTAYLLRCSNAVGLETNSGKNKCVLVSHHTTWRQIALQAAGKFFEP